MFSSFICSKGFGGVVKLRTCVVARSLAGNIPVDEGKKAVAITAVVDLF